jgi:hypothetical protein
MMMMRRRKRSRRRDLSARLLQRGKAEVDMVQQQQNARAE